ncbi:MAG: alpha-amylase [Gammaproteobacteria bacterium]|nr:MAG: alpha-amylase [Pseudomonadota bacterium]PIE38349.1 MAG: alpha-amylase [Gammaproteobacteria bacterium]
MTDENSSILCQKIRAHLHMLYPDADQPVLAKKCLEAMGLEESSASPPPHQNIWDQQDAVLITYGNSIVADDEVPLQTLNRFCTRYLEDTISTVHVLPFFPYSSDDGFSVMDYTAVNPSLGEWGDIKALSEHYKVMCDLVLNHCSTRSRWYENFKAGRDPGANYFVTAAPDFDTSGIIRPRTSALLKEQETSDGTKYVWCTFSHDQADLDFSNPDVLLEFISIIKFYLESGVRWFRLDAVAFLWKTPGTPCLSQPETHEVIRLLRLLIEHKAQDTVIISETNIPNRENLTYFGNANEAHLIYNFSLPPLLINTLISGNCSTLKNWLMTMPPAQSGTAYLNFIASHDGIGLRPTEGLLSNWEVDTLVSTMEQFGAKLSSRTTSDGSSKPYEINVSLWDALQGTTRHGPDELQLQRFICAHGIMLALEGIPALYIHSFLGTENDNDGVAHTGAPRSINRHTWPLHKLENKLGDELHHIQVLRALTHLLKKRKNQLAFHPNATQYTLHTGEKILSFWRQSVDRSQSIFAVFNISDQPQMLSLSDLNLIATDDWIDLVTDQHYEDKVKLITLAPYQFIWLTNKVCENTCEQEETGKKEETD